MTVTVMLVDDQARFIAEMEKSLHCFGIAAIVCGDADTAIELATLHRPDAIVVANAVAPAGAMAFCRRLQADAVLKTRPLLIYAREYETLEAALMLEAGASDYFSMNVTGREVAARVKRALRDALPVARPAGLRSGELFIDDGAREVTCKGINVGVTATEFKILHGLARSAGLVLSREQIADFAGIDHFAAADRSIDTHIKNIRRKLGTVGDRLQTVRGFGYRMRETG